MKRILLIALLSLEVPALAAKEKKIPKRVKVVEYLDPFALREMQLETLCMNYSEFREQKRMVDEGRKPKSYQDWYYLKPAAVETLEAVLLLKGITLAELVSIRKREFHIGMSKAALLASMGLPNRTNRSVGVSGEVIQRVYGRTYVYLSDGVVTSWQD